MAAGGAAAGPAALVGREPELRAIRDLFADGGTGGALCLTGEPGIGKTSVLDAAAHHAAGAGHLVLRTLGVETETGLPHAGLHQLLHAELDGAGALPPGQRDALLSAFGMTGGGTTGDVGPEPFLVALAALTLLSALAAARPVTVLADDVQWLDPQSQEALAFLARRADRARLVVVGALRSGHPGPFTAAGLPVLELARLDDGSARRLLSVHGAGLPPAARERVLDVAVGNPLALVELPRTAADAPGPAVGTGPLPLTARLEQAFAGRAARLPPATRTLLLVAAVTRGDELPEILAAAVRLDRSVTSEHLAPAVDAGLLEPAGAGVRFRHPLVRSAILQAAPLHRRHAANAALAAVLHDQPHRRAWHRAHSVVGPDDDVADELEATVAASAGRGAVRSAIEALEAAAALSTDPTRRGRRLLRAAQYAFGLGSAELVDRLVRAAALTELSELDEARLVWLREIFHDGVPGDAARVLRLCDTARRAAAAGDADLALDLLQGAALRCWWSDTGPAARAAVASAVRSLTGHEDDPRAIAALGVAEPVLAARRVVELLSRVVVEEVDDADALRLLGMAAHAVGETPLAADLLDRSEVRLRAQGRFGLLIHVLGIQVTVRLGLGDWARAGEAVEEGRRLADEVGQPVWSLGVLSGEARLAALRGDRERALRLAAEAEQAAGGRHLTSFLACAQLARGCAWAATGRPDRAFEELRRIFDPADPAHHPREAVPGVGLLAEAAVRSGHRDEARALLGGLEATAAVTPAADLAVALLHARAVLADDAAADALFRAALREDLVRWPWVRARIELAHGTWLRRRNRRVECRAPLRAAAATLEQMGATTWAAQARAELRAAGERPDRPDRPDGTDGTDGRAAPAVALSAQELRIARLAASGLSNRDIGRELHLSPRTVGSHLYRLFPKLGVTSRGQLAERLPEDPDPG